MNILYIVPYVPSLVRVRPYHLTRGLAALGHQVRVLTLWTNRAERAELEQLNSEVLAVNAEPLRAARAYWNSLRALPTSKPLQAAYCWQPALAKQIDRYASEADVVHVEHLRGARYGLALMNGGDSNRPPIVWDSVDCISELFEQASADGASAFSRLITRFDLPRTQRYEGELLDRFDRVVVTSDNDAAALRKLNGNGVKPAVVPNGVDMDYFAPDQSSRRHGAIVMTGKMSYHANVAMVERFVDDILPLIWRERQDVDLWIVGKSPPRSVRELEKHDRIQVTGTVPDIRPYLRSATLAVAPAPYAVGVQNKVLEAMACETPVVASPQAVAGLNARHGRELLVAEKPEEFAAAVLSLLEDPGVRRTLGRAGRRYVEEQHRWSDTVTKLEDIYSELINAAS